MSIFRKIDKKNFENCTNKDSLFLQLWWQYLYFTSKYWLTIKNESWKYTPLRISISIHIRINYNGIKSNAYLLIKRVMVLTWIPTKRARNRKFADHVYRKRYRCIDQDKYIEMFPLGLGFVYAFDSYTVSMRDNTHAFTHVHWSQFKIWNSDCYFVWSMNEFICSY